MKSRDYCCCAIPTVNAGIYSVLTEQLVLGIVAGTLSIATPSIVGAATPSFAKWIFTIACYVAAAVQVLGFLGVARESTIIYRRYVTLHIMTIVAVFAVAATWIIVSATRHSTAKTKCVNDFFTDSNSGTPTASEAETMCNIFPWVDIGLMGGLLGFFAVVHVRSVCSDLLLCQTILMNSRRSTSTLLYLDTGVGNDGTTGTLTQVSMRSLSRTISPWLIAQTHGTVDHPMIIYSTKELINTNTRETRVARVFRLY